MESVATLLHSYNRERTVKVGGGGRDSDVCNHKGDIAHSHLGACSPRTFLRHSEGHFQDHLLVIVCS